VVFSSSFRRCSGVVFFLHFLLLPTARKTSGGGGGGGGRRNPHTIQELKDISHAVAAIKITTLHRVYLNMVTA